MILNSLALSLLLIFNSSIAEAASLNPASNHETSLSVSSFEKTDINIQIDKESNYDLFAVGAAKGRLELYSNNGQLVASSDEAGIYSISLAKGSYVLSHKAAKVPEKDSIDCSKLGPTCRWLRAKLYTPEKLSISVVKTEKLAATAKGPSRHSLKMNGSDSQLISFEVTEAGTYRIQTYIDTKNEDTTLFLYDSPRKQARMKLIAKDRNSARSPRAGSRSDAKIIADLPVGKYLIMVLDAKNITKSSNLKYNLVISKK